MDLLFTSAVLGGLIVAAWRGGRALEHAFQQLEAYGAGPRPYPDQDPAPAHAAA
jgi:hypothetical protein